MVNPLVAESSVLFTFIEIMETICEKAFKRAFNSNGYQKFLSMSELKNFIFEICHSKKLEAASFTNVTTLIE